MSRKLLNPGNSKMKLLEEEEVEESLPHSQIDQEIGNEDELGEDELEEFEDDMMDEYGQDALPLEEHFSVEGELQELREEDEDEEGEEDGGEEEAGVQEVVDEPYDQRAGEKDHTLFSLREGSALDFNKMFKLETH